MHPLKKLYLHIGFNKTGSTSLQNDLARNTAALQQQGILYPCNPKAAYSQTRQHVPLAAAIPGRQVKWVRSGKQNTLNQAYDALLADTAAVDCETLVLSSEAFGGLDMNAVKIAWVKERLADFDVTVVAYIRRQDHYLLSTYQENIKKGGTQRFQFDQFRSVRQLDFAVRLAPWREVFGFERVIVRPFDPNFWPSGELFYDFLQIIGASPKRVSLSKPLNESLDRRTVEMLRQLNVAINSLEPKLNRAGKKAIRTAVLQAARPLAADRPREKMALSTEQTETLRRHFQEGNAVSLEGSGISPSDFFLPPAEGKAARLLPEHLDLEHLLLLAAKMAGPSKTVRQSSRRRQA